MAKARTNRVLTEQEIDEQMRLSIKKELLAYCHDVMPRSAKIDDLIEMWKQVNTNLQLVCAERKLQMRFLEMLPKKLKEAEINRIRPLMLKKA